MWAANETELWCALNRMIAEYWAEVDENGGAHAHEFYLPDGLYVIGNNRFEGRQQIADFYARRRHGSILTRHLVANLRVSSDGDRQARMLGLMSLYRADGKSPFQGARPPAMIADFDAQCRLGEDRRWRFQSHLLQPFIVGTDLPASITIRSPAR